MGVLILVLLAAWIVFAVRRRKKSAGCCVAYLAAFAVFSLLGL